MIDHKKERYKAIDAVLDLSEAETLRRETLKAIKDVVDEENYERVRLHFRTKLLGLIAKAVGERFPLDLQMKALNADKMTDDELVEFICDLRKFFINQEKHP